MRDNYLDQQGSDNYSLDSETLLTPPPRWSNYSPSLANYRDEAVFVSGGFDSTFKKLSKVLVYIVKNDSWLVGEGRVPELNMARKFHNSCSLGDRVYVFGGYNREDLNSVEWLDAAKLL